MNPLSPLNTPLLEPDVLDDDFLSYLLETELKHSSDQDSSAGEHGFFSDGQEVTPSMRKGVTEWMWNVCTSVECQDEVFFVALHYMDRYLSCSSIPKLKLFKTLAAACLLLASKVREPKYAGLTFHKLVIVSKESTTSADIIHWEQCVIGSLKYDLSAVTPLHFLDSLLKRLPIQNKECPNTDIIKEHAQCLIALAAMEHIFYMKYSSSLIAASSIAISLSGMYWHIKTGTQLKDLLNTLAALIGVEQDSLSTCMIEMEVILTT